MALRLYTQLNLELVIQQAVSTLVLYLISSNYIIIFPERDGWLIGVVNSAPYLYALRLPS